MLHNSYDILKASFDIAGLLLVLVLLMSLAFRKMTRGATNRLFLIMIFSCTFACIFDIIAIGVDGSGSNDPFLLYLSHTMYYVFQVAQAPLLLFFVISIIDIWHKVQKNIPLKILLFAPYSLFFLMMITNPFTNWVFSVEDGYKHESLFFLTYVSMVPYIIATFAYIIKYRQQLSFRRALCQSTMMILLISSMAIHLLIPALRIDCFAVSLSLLIASVGIQRPEDYIDSFTGLHKQSAYAYDLSKAFKNDKHVHIVMLNIGNFFTIQNMIGYDESIELLSSIANKLILIVKDLNCHCMLYHLDRGRFRIVFSESEREKAELTAEFVMNEFKLRSRFNGFDMNLAPYVVLARCPEEIESFKSLMAFGNDFHEKHPYTGQVMMASEVYNAKEFTIHNNIDSIIKHALEDGRFQVYYQPIYSVEQQKFISAEALLRLFDEEYGFISPEIIITAAEKSGAIHEIGNLVFEEVCKFIASPEYKRLGLDYIEINLSVAQCMHGSLADSILKIMRKYKVSPNNINLEITETAAAYTQRAMTENLKKLSEAGISFSLDDYGTGYSNIKRVISLPLKIVKLDKSFVDEQHNPKMWIFLQNTVKMLKDMQMEIVVEGIETKEMMETFSDLKCDFIQGYFFSRPVCKDEFVKFIAASGQ